MKLSDAIRKGSEQRPQAFGTYFQTGKARDEIIGSCAMGAAIEGYTGLADDRGYSELLEAFPIIEHVKVLLPVEPIAKIEPPISWNTTFDLDDAIFELNDTYKWTREQIADWIEKIEKMEEDHKA